MKKVLKIKVGNKERKRKFLEVQPSYVKVEPREEKGRGTAKFFKEKILPWYRKNKRVLPWRKKNISPYEVWVSEVMLQQTQVSRVIDFYTKFLRRFPSISSLAKASWEEFLPFYEGLGYYARGRNMQKTAKIIREKYGGKFPQEKKSLTALPGIGEYTASAILSFGFGKKEVAFDTNFKKIFGTKEIAERVFRESRVSGVLFNSAVMDYASAHREGGSKNKVLRIKKDKDEERKRGKGENEETFIILHENHKRYFSSQKGIHTPFFLPNGIKTREGVKKYFLAKWKLRVSVRPFVSQEGGKIFATAQILLGKHRFQSFSKKEAQKTLQRLQKQKLLREGGTFVKRESRIILRLP
ncbi:MAG: hypothetical protein AAB545_00535 [Patescibacteria group bacterium]